jgi:uncharacterized membrane protein YfcA
MDSFIVLIVVGFLIGTFGTLIGAGGGFLLVPLLLITHPDMPPEIVTAVSIAMVAVNAISGSVAYARAKRIDYKAGLVFAAYTVPGSILGVFLTAYIPRHAFNIIFGILLFGLAAFLFTRIRQTGGAEAAKSHRAGRGWKRHQLVDAKGQAYSYTYNQRQGNLVSIGVGFLSPLLGIGGGIIHVPAMVQWLRFPLHVATATSHFILAIMSTISVAVHVFNGDYSDSNALRLVLGLCVGVVPGAQLGAFLSHKISNGIIIRILAVCLGLVGIRLLMNSF